MERDDWLAWYTARGLATIPVVARGKRPLRAGWRTASKEAWQAAPREANLGVVCGSASGGLVVLDFDTRDGVHEAMGMRPEMLADHTLVVRTARGWHVYAREDGRGTTSPWKGLDVRGEGSFVVAPPSVHASDVAYEFLRLDSPIASLASLPVVLERAAEEEATAEVDWERVEAWIALQAPKLRASWGKLRAGAPADFDRSRADFAVARCLWEGGYSLEDVATILCALDGSKAKERGREYAVKTAARASAVRSDRAATASRPARG